MLIEKNKIVSFHYRLREGDEELEHSHDGDPMLLLFGSGALLAGLEQAMAGHRAGDAINVTLAPEQAYGERREQAIQRIAIKHLSSRKKLKPGDIVSINTDDGGRDVTVVKVGKFMADVDSNHPLAGRTLTFDIDIVDVREASEEELSHGHAHGAGGHQH